MMKKLLTMAMFLAAVFALSACGGAGQGTGQSGEQEAAPPEPTQAEAPANGDEPQPEEAASEEAAPSDDGSGEGVSEDAPSSGPTATTVDGEEVSLGGGSDVTALFFMAGW